MFCFTAYDLKAICLQCVVYFLFDRIYSLVKKKNHGTTDSQSRFQFNSCLLCVCRLVSNKIQYTRSIIKSRFMINMNFSTTELFSDIHLGLCYLKQFNILYFANILNRPGLAIFFLINELFETLFNIAVIVASMQASIYNTIIAFFYCMFYHLYCIII